jgi:hypothetical protein
LFNLALVERKWKVLLNRGPFLLEQPLQWWGKILFVCFFAAAILLLVVTASTGLWWVITRLTALQARWMAKLTVLPVARAYFAAITAQSEAVQYFGARQPWRNREGGAQVADLVLGENTAPPALPNARTPNVDRTVSVFPSRY